MKRITSFRLSDEALERLAELMIEMKLSGGKVVEGLILGRFEDPPTERPKLSEKVAALKTTDTPIAKATSAEDLVPLKQHVPQPPRAGAVPPPLIRRKTTLTGQPFGPVPKGK